MSLKGASIAFGTDGVTLGVVDTLEGPGQSIATYETTHSLTSTAHKTHRAEDFAEPGTLSVTVPVDTATDYNNANAVTLGLAQAITLTGPTSLGNPVDTFVGIVTQKGRAYQKGNRNVRTFTIQISGAITEGVAA